MGAEKVEKPRGVGRKALAFQSIFLCIAVCALAFVACGGEDEKKTNTKGLTDINIDEWEEEVDPNNPVGLSTVTVTPFAGSTQGYGDGVGAAAKFDTMEGLATDAAGNLYVADSHNHCIRKVTPQGVVSTLAGGAEVAQDGMGSVAGFKFLHGITTDVEKKTLYVMSEDLFRICEVTLEGDVNTLFGSSGSANSIQGISMDAAGNLYVLLINQIFKLALGDDRPRPFVGGGENHVDGQGSEAGFGFPMDVTIDKAGNLYVVDELRRNIRKVTPQGVTSVFAGGTDPYTNSGCADGVGTAAKFRTPRGITIDEADNLYVVDNDCYSIRKVTPEGVVTTLAGRSGSRGGEDGSDTQGKGNRALFYSPEKIAADLSGNLYVTDNDRIYKITF